jgi:hypothetical protein
MQTIDDDALWLILQPVQQALEEPLGSCAITFLLHQDVQHHPVLIHGTPQMMQHMLSIARTWAPAAQSPGEFSPVLATPMADAFMGDRQATLGQDELEIAQAEAEEVIQPHSMTDDLGREAVAVIQGWLRGHAISLTRPSTARQSRLICQCRAGSKGSAGKPSSAIALGEALRTLAGA